MDKFVKLEKINYKFDLIIHSHFFEHLFNPIKFLKLIKLKLNRNGLHIFSMPNMKPMIKKGLAHFRPFYTNASSNISTDLDYVNTSSLALNGGTMKSVGAVDAILDLPAPGAVGSISDDQAISVDGIIPNVLQVRSTKADGSYRSAEVLDILVEFDEIVPTLVELIGEENLETYTPGEIITS